MSLSNNMASYKKFLLLLSVLILSTAPVTITHAAIDADLSPTTRCSSDDACPADEHCHPIQRRCLPRSGVSVHPEPTEEPPSFTPILPRLQIPIPTLQPFTSPLKQTDEQGRTFLNVNFIGPYIIGLYKYLVGAASIIAGVMYVWAGVKWLTSAGSAEGIGDAKKKIAGASVGLILVLGSYVIINLVNPQLVLFKSLRVEYVEPQLLTQEEEEEEETGVTASGDTACNSIESCRTLCQMPSSEWPTSTQKTISPEQTALIPTNIVGLQTNSGVRATPQMIDALRVAAASAQAASGGPYSIKITSGYRPLSTQILLVCQKITAADQGSYDINKIGTAIAWPGGSNHGVGKAVDVQLLKGGQVLVCSGCFDSQTSSQYAQTAPILADIMFQAGFVRFCKEIWHFELPTNTPCRSNSCRGNVVGCP